MQPDKTVIGANGAVPFLALYYSIAPTKRDLKEVETAKATLKKIGVDFKIHRWHSEVNVIPTEETKEERTSEELTQLCRQFLKEAGLPQDAAIDPQLTLYENREWELADLAEAFSIEPIPATHTHSLVIHLNQEFPCKEIYRLKRLVPTSFQVRVRARQIVLWPLSSEKHEEASSPLAALHWYKKPLQALGMWNT